MVSQPDKTFIYGRFVWPNKSKKFLQPPPSVADFLGLDTDRIAIEVLREFSARELIGKIYLKGGSPLAFYPADINTVKQQDWYKSYEQLPKAVREQSGAFYFDVENSGPWRVLFMRGESDPSGPYVAIALQYK